MRLVSIEFSFGTGIDLRSESLGIGVGTLLSFSAIRYRVVTLVIPLIEY
jgi:hypothetical protein